MCVTRDVHTLHVVIGRLRFTSIATRSMRSHIGPDHYVPARGCCIQRDGAPQPRSDSIQKGSVLMFDREKRHRANYLVPVCIFAVHLVEFTSKIFLPWNILYVGISSPSCHCPAAWGLLPNANHLLTPRSMPLPLFFQGSPARPFPRSTS